MLRQSWHLADAFVDAGVSGSSFETRPRLQATLAKSNIGASDVILCLKIRKEGVYKSRGYSDCPSFETS
ncbi:hypothetical protein [Agrobacterium tumefaciens]|uniref:hypothetical protein n=1 Tax=Agrobacterium tumefaciens TaxID=358 RepID=UPI00287C0752|nr:hypothetical protein [Agrobacterium tumefaciens]MDS7594186.1 hypothetical protein [Agrobacterium tumefaciens]